MLTTEFHPAATTSRRLLIVLHGLGDSIAGYRWMPDELRLPWLNYLLVNAPDDYYGGFSWYDFTADPSPGVERSRQLLVDLLDQRRAAGWPAEQTTLFGFSQGCVMTWQVGLRYPHRFAGLVGISGYVHDLPETLQHLSPIAQQQRFLVTHGTMDPLIPFPQVRQQILQMQAAGLNIEWHEFDKPHTIAGEEELGIIRRFITAGYPS